MVALPDWGWGGSKGVSFALSQGGVRRMAEFDREALHRFSRGIDGTTDWVQPFFEGLERSRSAWHELEGGAILPLCAAIEEHWRAVPLLAKMGMNAT